VLLHVSDMGFTAGHDKLVRTGFLRQVSFTSMMTQFGSYISFCSNTSVLMKGSIRHLSHAASGSARSGEAGETAG
jgi:hypothetical protein